MARAACHPAGLTTIIFVEALVTAENCRYRKIAPLKTGSFLIYLELVIAVQPAQSQLLLCHAEREHVLMIVAHRLRSMKSRTICQRLTTSRVCSDRLETVF
jgi:hypothetical protein